MVQTDHPQNSKNFTISPILPDGQMRILLSWGEFPYDLDSHLIGYTPDSKQFHVYYHNQVFRWEQYEIANLDVDDQVSYGPETITILQPVPDGTVYAVHDYSNRSKSDSTALSNSGAVVSVYTGGSQESIDVVHHYELVSGNYTWTEAYEDALSRGGRIAHFDSLDTYSHVISELQADENT